MVVNKWISDVDKKETANNAYKFLKEKVARMVLASGMKREDFDVLSLEFPERRGIPDEDDARAELKNVVESIGFCSINARLLINCVIQGLSKNKSQDVLNCEKSAYYVWRLDALNQFANAYLKCDLHIYKNGLFAEKRRKNCGQNADEI